MEFKAAKDYREKYMYIYKNMYTWHMYMACA